MFKIDPFLLRMQEPVNFDVKGDIDFSQVICECNVEKRVYHPLKHRSRIQVVRPDPQSFSSDRFIKTSVVLTLIGIGVLFYLDDD